MKRTTVYAIYGIIIFLVLIGGLLIYITSQKDSDEISVIKIGYNIQSVNYGPIMVAYEKSFFDKSGCKVQLVPLKSGKEIRQAIATGHLDMGLTSAANFFTIISAGAPVKIIAPLNLVNILLFVRPDNEIQTFADLREKKIYGGKGGQSEFVFRRALKKEGIDVSEIEFVHINKEYRGMALTKKKALDAVPISRYDQEEYEKLGAVVHKEWTEKGYGDELWPGTVIAVNKEFLDKKTEAVEKVLDAFIESHKFITISPNESAQMIAEHINLAAQGAAEFSPEEILRIWEDGLSYTLWYEPGVLVEMAQLSSETGMIEKELTLEEIFDSRFENKLRTAQDEIYESKN